MALTQCVFKEDLDTTSHPMLVLQVHLCNIDRAVQRLHDMFGIVPFSVLSTATSDAGHVAQFVSIRVDTAGVKESTRHGGHLENATLVICTRNTALCKGSSLLCAKEAPSRCPPENSESTPSVDSLSLLQQFYTNLLLKDVPLCGVITRAFFASQILHLKPDAIDTPAAATVKDDEAKESPAAKKTTNKKKQKTPLISIKEHAAGVADAILEHVWENVQPKPTKAANDTTGESTTHRRRLLRLCSSPKEVASATVQALIKKDDVKTCIANGSFDCIASGYSHLGQVVAVFHHEASTAGAIAKEEKNSNKKKVYVDASEVNPSSCLVLVGVEEQVDCTHKYITPDTMHPEPFRKSWTSAENQQFPVEVCRAQRKMWEIFTMCSWLCVGRKECKHSSDGDDALQRTFKSPLENTAVLVHALQQLGLKCCDSTTTTATTIGLDIGASPGGWLAELLHRFGCAGVVGVDPGLLNDEALGNGELWKKRTIADDEEVEKKDVSTPPVGKGRLLHLPIRFEQLCGQEDQTDSEDYVKSHVVPFVSQLPTNNKETKTTFSAFDVVCCDMNTSDKMLVDLMAMLDGQQLLRRPNGILFLTLKNTFKGGATSSGWLKSKKETIARLSELLKLQFCWEVQLFANTTRETTFIAVTGENES